MPEWIDMKDLHLTLPLPVAEQLDRVARERGETRNGLIRLALEQFFEAERKRKLSDEMRRYALEMGEHSRELISKTQAVVRKKLLKDTKW
jgi:metal-responsive CopG/Arc/MetJ family transcriptional regulator